jgi:zinc protease
MERFQLGMDYYQRYAQRVRAIKRADVVEAARAFIHPERLVVATAGP